MPAWRWLLAGLALALAAPVGALAPEPSVNVAATGTVEVIFSPWGDGEAALLKAIGSHCRLFTSNSNRDDINEVITTCCNCTCS